eukprot:UN06526
MYGLWLILFTRLYYVFKGSAYRLSCFTLSIYRTILAILPFVFISIFLPIWPSNDINDPKTQLFMVASSLFSFSMLFCISITLLFLYKLCKVYSNESISNVNNTRTLLPLITKNTILAVISLIFNILAISSWSSSTRGTINRVIMSDYMILFDVYSNFICTLLAYQFFHRYYKKLCGCFDKSCKSCCGSLLSSTEESSARSARKRVMQLERTKSMSGMSSDDDVISQSNGKTVSL